MGLDIEKLVLPQNFQDMPGAKKLWTTIPVRKPGKTEFFRVLDSEEYTMPAAMVELKEEGETYLVNRDLLADLSEVLTPVQLVVAMSRTGTLMIWPVKLPQERRNAWHHTALQAAELAKKRWICMRANMSAGCYEIHEATAKLPEPEFPTDELSFTQMLDLAFRDFYVDTLEHPLVKRLTGQV